MITALETALNADQKAIIRAALYFDVFRYPLTREELFENAAIGISMETFLYQLQLLLEQGLLKEEQGFILTHERNRDDVQRRLSGNKGAAQIMPTALQYSRRISRFPFVTGVFISGSLSKNYFDSNSDVDFFIVVKSNRVWICRSLLILRYKLLPQNLKKLWCTNYFISIDNLNIPDTNIFTATELAHLLPVVNDGSYEKLLAHNSWYRQYYPNKQVTSSFDTAEKEERRFKNWVESFFSGAFGNWIDDKLLSLTLRRWRKKYPQLSYEDFDLQFRSRKDVCKRHSHGFQNKVLALLEEKTKAFEDKFNIRLS